MLPINPFFNFLDNKLRVSFPAVPVAEDKEEKGFAISDFVARTVGSITCFWSPLKLADASEDPEIAHKARKVFKGKVGS